MFDTPLPAFHRRALSWAGTALPIGVCASIWLMGHEVHWLAMLQHVIGLAVLAWTALRLMRRPETLHPARLARSFGAFWGRADAGIVVLYVLLMLQPVLGVAGRALAGCGLVVGGVMVLPGDASLAHDIVRVHGFNAVLLLVMIAAQIVREAAPLIVGPGYSSSSSSVGHGRCRLR